ncbi:MAG: ligase [Rhodoferax sp.]|nr:ligase [Rhodoferax sp.]
MHPIGPAAVQRRSVLQWLGLAMLPTAARAEAPALMLANVYHPGLPLAGYWVSEKYDGVRGFWDGHTLRTRGGEHVAAPAWFTAGWPAEAMDGELWAGHGAFGQAVSTVRQQTPVDAAWRGMRFMVFDLPAQGGTFDERIPALQQLLARLNIAWVVPVAQFRVASHTDLMNRMKATVRAGGEGLVLHRGASLYRGVRSDDLVKVKPFDDAEARVLAHIAGKGKYAGAMGALLVQTPEGRRFKLGTGFSDAQRRSPPAVGSWVTYRFRDVNPSGLPRFASFMRVREDLPN